ncbi:Arc family DNA-binding protein [Kerstersia gyiorum]|uniref:Arc family DNA-binding protein n=1 Tax=Kerstersia gyiorum TaxID=206506 RepID=UPI00214F8BC2|nr:Arc family DNA-binding protein [Kerstersia gyiorum]MCR4158833.1 Arc family DNA-binding protein [Kerstersia gyiorum]
MSQDKKISSREADKFMLRFTDGSLRQELKARAAKNRRSMNAEILCLIEAGLAKENAPEGEISEALGSINH